MQGRWLTVPNRCLQQQRDGETRDIHAFDDASDSQNCDEDFIPLCINKSEVRRRQVEVWS